MKEYVEAPNKPSPRCSNPECYICRVREVEGIEIERRRDGWVFRKNGVEYGPVEDIYSLNSVEMAEKLSVDVKKAEMARLQAYDIEVKRPLTIDELSEILGITVKKDEENKIITFLCMLSAYTERNQFNVSFRAESSTGKSYIPLEISQLFPSEDVIKIAYSSPTAFYHERGEHDRETNVITVNLEKKILIFLDQPHDMLLERLRPLLSHDEKELVYKITDKREKSGLKTKTVRIIGFPSVIFCTGKLRVEDQEATRMFLLSPETSQEKIREAIYLKMEKESDRDAFIEWVEKNPKRKALRERIKKIKDEKIRDVRIPNIEKIAEEFFSTRKILKPRHMRDIDRIISLIKGMALLNLWHRKRDGDIIEADEEDIEEAFKLYEAVSKAQELSIPPYVQAIYEEIILPESMKSEREGITVKELMKLYLKRYGRPISERTIRREIIPALLTSGLIVEEPDPEDKRKILIKPIETMENTLRSECTFLNENHINELRSSEKICTHEPWGKEGKKTSLWRPGRGLCEFCGREVHERYAVSTKFGVRFLCRECASEAPS
ncbi:MAG: hypothetical protein QXH51_07645 [Candidatus Bathyarchaeia archaeon]